MLEKGGCGGADAHFSTYTFLTTVVTGSENQQPPSALPFKCQSQSAFTALTTTRRLSVVSKHGSGASGAAHSL